MAGFPVWWLRVKGPAYSAYRLHTKLHTSSNALYPSYRAHNPCIQNIQLCLRVPIIKNILMGGTFFIALYKQGAPAAYKNPVCS